MSRANIPQPKRPLDYEQLPFGPFRLDTTDDTHIDQIEDIHTAVGEFLTFAIPPQCHTAGVTDRYGTIVIGYTHDGLDGGITWAGISQAVEVLRNHPLMEPLLFYAIEHTLAGEQ